ncbi:hypothetical protein B0H10DRAFT_806052 [Mycena sp. CBHHK59/15]|nr:hypothetical protein B0H10DRAFT_806052 [Mycena sp. CBHHK59/15]
MASALPEAVAPEESADLALPSEAPASKIPPELVQLTIEQLRYDSAALRTFSLVSKQWLHIGRSYLFSHIFLSAPRADSPATPCSRLYEVLSLSPGIALNIRHITIIAGAAHRDSPRTSRILRWISLDQTLPLFLDLLRNTNPNRIQSLHIRLSSERWVDLPDVLRESIRSLVNLATMTDVDLQGLTSSMRLYSGSVVGSRASNSLRLQTICCCVHRRKALVILSRSANPSQYWTPCTLGTSSLGLYSPGVSEHSASSGWASIRWGMCRM